MPDIHGNLLSPKRIGIYLALAFLLIPAVHLFAETNTMLYAGYLGVLGFLCCFAIMPIACLGAEKLRLVDAPDEARKTHAHPTPLAGGIAIYVAFMVTILLNFHFSEEMKAIVAGGTLIFIVGLADDAVGLSARVRLVAQLAAAGLLVAMGVHVTFVPNWLGGIFTETVITLIWIVGITNSMNFIDGMDGLAGGASIIHGFFFGLVALLTQQAYMMYLAVAIAGSSLGFIPYNFRKTKPAAVFLGDSGATFLGFVLASFAILGDWGESFVDLAVPVLIMSVLIFDMTLTTVVRITSKEVRSIGEWLHYTGRDHFHHRLADLNVGKRNAAWLFFSVSVCFAIEAVIVLYAETTAALLVLLHSIIAFTILGIILVVSAPSRKDAKTVTVDKQNGSGGPHGS